MYITVIVVLTMWKLRLSLTKKTKQIKTYLESTCFVAYLEDN